MRPEGLTARGWYLAMRGLEGATFATRLLRTTRFSSVGAHAHAHMTHLRFLGYRARLARIEARVRREAGRE